VAILRGLLAVQIAAETAILDQVQLPAPACAALYQREARAVVRLDLTSAMKGTLRALNGRDRQSARTHLHDLIIKIGDRSNLILDNVIETYYLTDVTLNCIPDIFHDVAEILLNVRLCRAGCRSAQPACPDHWRYVAGIESVRQFAGGSV
jgi:hypothetical protein